jgi:hypothetical protein
MNKPTKNQLTAAVNHYQTSVAALLEQLKTDVTDEGEIGARLSDILSSAPSLEPQPKAVAEVVEESADVVDPEAPAVA